MLDHGHRAYGLPIEPPDERFESRFDFLGVRVLGLLEVEELVRILEKIFQKGLRGRAKPLLAIERQKPPHPKWRILEPR